MPAYACVPGVRRAGVAFQTVFHGPAERPGGTAERQAPPTGEHIPCNVSPGSGNVGPLGHGRARALPSQRRETRVGHALPTPDPQPVPNAPPDPRRDSAKPPGMSRELKRPSLGLPHVPVATFPGTGNVTPPVMSANIAADAVTSRELRYTSRMVRTPAPPGQQTGSGAMRRNAPARSHQPTLEAHLKEPPIARLQPEDADAALNVTSGAGMSASGPATLELPLRGLASDGAEVLVEPPLRALPGVLTVTVVASEFRVRVAYDAARISPEVIRETLHGIVPPDTAHGAPASSAGEAEQWRSRDRAF